MIDVNNLAGSDLARSILPLMQEFAASILEAEGNRTDPRVADLAKRLRAGTAGGNAVEGLNQNSDGDFPETLNTFWRVLIAFEECANGGHLSGKGLQTPRNGVEEPRPWMLHDAGEAIRTLANAGNKKAAAVLGTADRFLEVPLPAYRRL